MQEEPDLEPEWQPARIKETLAVVSSEDMCFSCHDGFVKDSRIRTWLGKGHSVGRSPSGRVRVPDSMPLDQAGQVYCGTCHNPHGSGPGGLPGISTPQKSGTFTPAKLPAFYLRLDGSELCGSCHPDHLAVQGTKHHLTDPESLRKLENHFGKISKQHECIPCHRVHGAQASGLWFVPLPPPQGTFDRDESCRKYQVCHSQTDLHRIAPFV